MSYSPAQIAARYAAIAGAKARQPLRAQLALAVLAGMFVALAAFGAHMVASLLSPSGAAGIVAALLFPAGLAMILIAGGELFTGNCLMVLGAGKKACTAGRMLRCWGIVYAGNAVGAAAIALLSVWAAPGGGFVQAAISAAEAKAALSAGEAFLRGILCNILVCAAVWMSYSTDSSMGKIVCMYFPVVLFVLCGTEHCIANVYYFLAAVAGGGLRAYTVGGILLQNMLPVTLGNIVGGSVVFSGLVWAGLFMPQKKKAPTDAGDTAC